MKTKIYFLLCLLPIFVLISPGKIIAQAPTVVFTPLVTGLSSPVDMAVPGDGSNRLFIVQQTGTIKIYQNGSLRSTPFLDVTSLISTDYSERGLLSMVFHPNYKNNRYFFIYYTALSGNVTVARYQTSVADSNVADPSSAVILFSIPKPYKNHNGGKLNFGPDGDLYFGTGDGGSGGNPENTAQMNTSLLGKLIRVNVDDFTTAPYYTIPSDNPFAGSVDVNVKKEIFAMGLRNPWRWSFDKQTGDLWLADVGQDLWEEANFVSAGITANGLNFGWRCYEGTATYNTTGCGSIGNYYFPFFTYPHNDTGGIAIVGGYYYRGTKYPDLQGYYIFTDYTSGNGWLTTSNGSGGWITTRQTNWPSPASSFGQDENGELYMTSLNGTIYTVGTAIVTPIKLLSFSAEKHYDRVIFDWTTENEISAKQFILEHSTDGINFSAVTSVDAKGQSQNTYEYGYDFKNIISDPDNYYRIKMINVDGSFTYSQIVKLSKLGYDGAVDHPIIVQGHDIHIYSSGTIKLVKVIDEQGNIVFEKNFNLSHTYIDINLATKLARGTYIIRLFTDENIETQKVFLQ